MIQLSLDTPVRELFMVGPAYVRRLEKLEIKTAEDLLHHYPFRYEDYRLISKINHLQEGEVVTVIGEIITFENIYTKWGKRIQKMLVADDTGQLPVVFFNQPFLKRILKPGLAISLSGKVETSNHKLTLISPEYELIKDSPGASRSFRSRSGLFTTHTGRLVPVYPETYGVSSKWLRSRIAPLLASLRFKIPDWLPPAIKRQNNLADLSSALLKIHFPENRQQIKTAKERLAFDELFLIQLQTFLRKQAWQKQKTSQLLAAKQEQILELITSLPFTLTADQNRVVGEILSDLAKDRPMNRLLQGDVGCGKTVVAAIAAYVAYLNGREVALMAPTEILAFQHYQTFKALLEPFGVKIDLLTGSRKLKTKSSKLSAISYQLSANILIGTHALLYAKLDFQNLGLVIIDEQHRFGVEQRAKLIRKGKTPHALIMTATPIPRTVALTLYGDLDLSVIREMPKGRQVVKTWVVPPEKREAAYGWIKKQIQENQNQAFIVCPLIEPSVIESMKNIKAAKEEFGKLSRKIFPDLALGLLHGRLKAKEKEAVVSDFRLKKLDILVATPVVEVGIDIPNAAIMLIEGADRFGLATLHQLRGRVGRRHQQSYCLLFASQKGKAYRRLKLMETSHNGKELAEMDLKWRGPGELYGTTQHGFIKFKLASFSDLALIAKTRKAAEALLKENHYQLKNLPLLKEKLEKDTIREVEPN